MRTVILYLAISLDGYLADKTGGVDWLLGEQADHAGDYGISTFLKQVDTVLMGYRTYRQVTEELSPDHWPYPELQTYVLTHRQCSEQKGISFVSGAPEALVAQLRSQPGTDIWICGGAEMAHSLICSGCIDEYRISIIPTLLGGGIRLFFGEHPSIPLHLVETKLENGIVELIYRVRREGTA